MAILRLPTLLTQCTKLINFINEFECECGVDVVELPHAIVKNVEKKSHIYLVAQEEIATENTTAGRRGNAIKIGAVAYGSKTELLFIRDMLTVLKGKLGDSAFDESLLVVSDNDLNSWLASSKALTNSVIPGIWSRLIVGPHDYFVGIDRFYDTKTKLYQWYAMSSYNADELKVAAKTSDGAVSAKVEDTIELQEYEVSIPMLPATPFIETGTVLYPQHHPLFVK